MPITAAELITDFNNTVTTYGQTGSLTTFTKSFSGADYDISYLSGGVTILFKCKLFPVRGDKAGIEQKLLEQGLIKTDDKQMFFPGSVVIKSEDKITVAGSEYSVLPTGIMEQELTGSIIYKKTFIRLINTGSFIGEI